MKMQSPRALLGRLFDGVFHSFGHRGQPVVASGVIEDLEADVRVGGGEELGTEVGSEHHDKVIQAVVHTEHLRVVLDHYGRSEK